MAIYVEKFQIHKFTTEKAGFGLNIPTTVFNVSEGNGIEDSLRYSPLWRGRNSVEEFRKKLWKEIQRWLPAYKAGEFALGQPKRYNAFYFIWLMRIVEAVKAHGDVKLLYISDYEHALLIKRCVEWLLTQV